MKKVKEIYDEVYTELTKELSIERLPGEPKSLDEIELLAHQFGKEFERRILEKTTRAQQQDVDKKKL